MYYLKKQTFLKHMSRLVLFITIITVSACSINNLPIESLDKNNAIYEHLQSQQEIFNYYVGVENNNIIALNGNGNEVYIEYLDIPASEKAFKRIKKQDRIENVDSSFSIKDLPTPNKIYTGTSNIVKDIDSYYSVYMITDRADCTLKISFYTTLKPQLNNQLNIVRSILKNGIYKPMLEDLKLGKIDFAGRNVSLANCYRYGVRNIQCDDYGQINWSIYESIERGEKAKKIQYRITKNKRGGEILSNEMVEILFEDKKLNARRVKYKIKVPKIVMGGSNILIIYYISTEVRGNYIHAVLSYYEDTAKDDALPLLISEFIRLKE